MPSALMQVPPAWREDVDSADLSGVSGTPTFFVNGRRHNGAYDIAGCTGDHDLRLTAGDGETRASPCYGRVVVAEDRSRVT